MARSKGKSVKLSDVAERAGASVSAVSLVINGRGKSLRIHQDTQQRILDAAKELGYSTPRQRNKHKIREAASLQPVIGLAFLSEKGIAEHEYFNDFFTYTSIELTNLNMSQLTNIGVKLEELPYALLNGPLSNANAYIFPTMSNITDEMVAALDSIAKPYVIFNRRSFPQRSSVVTNNFQRGYDLAHYLFDKGHKFICFMSPRYFESQAFEDRGLGIAKAASERGLKKNIFELSHKSGDEAVLQVRNFLSTNSEVTAIIAHSQQMCWDLLSVGKEVIGEKFSVGSLDHFQAIETPSYMPEVTGFKTNMPEMCTEAVRLLQGLINGEQEAKNKVVEVAGEFITGDTVKSLK